MSAGRPQLVVPFAFDQSDNALRLVRLGVARMIGRSSYDARRAADEIGRVVKDAEFRRNAEGLARLIGSEDGIGTACDALERSVSGER